MAARTNSLIFVLVILIVFSCGRAGDDIRKEKDPAQKERVFIDKEDSTITILYDTNKVVRYFGGLKDCYGFLFALYTQRGDSIFTQEPDSLFHVRKGIRSKYYSVEWDSLSAKNLHSVLSGTASIDSAKMLDSLENPTEYYRWVWGTGAFRGLQVFDQEQ